MSASDSLPEQEIADLAQQLSVPAERDLATDRHLLLKEHLMAEIQAAHPGFRPVRWPSVRRGTLALAAGFAVLAITVTASVLGTAIRSGGAGGGGPFGSGVSTVSLPRAAQDRVGRGSGTRAASRVQALYVRGLRHPDGRGKLHRKQVWTLGLEPVRRADDPGERTDVELGMCLRARSAQLPDLGSLTAYPTYKLLTLLPTRPGPLLARIKEANKAGHPNLRVMLTISNILINSIPPRKLTAALYRVAATMPGLHVVQHATDPHGRPGFGITFSSTGTRIEWIFNAKTLTLTGERITVAKNSKADRQFVPRAHAFTNNDG